MSNESERRKQIDRMVRQMVKQGGATVKHATKTAKAAAIRADYRDKKKG
tara:strand:- start:364 stop:510 length:147 start_codon:yes stop_codon:yes gene_type:complete